MEKYEVLIKILDELRSEAPDKYKSYHRDDEDSLKSIRARCYIHLFLKVNFGILDFVEREKYITDGPYDGGIDAYFIDIDEKKIYYIQSKFRNTKENFIEKDILYKELLAMDIARIIRDGEKADEKGAKYNGKILNMQKAISNLNESPMYKTEVIVLANASNKECKNIKRAIGDFDYSI
ncbi:MAG: hypothetical protein IMY72_13075 [Bacteroidetes bacterium]|nr:hypothetical protein [Bacteroidota bacterium]